MKTIKEKNEVITRNLEVENERLELRIEHLEKMLKIAVDTLEKAEPGGPRARKIRIGLMDLIRFEAEEGPFIPNYKYFVSEHYRTAERPFIKSNKK